MTVFDRTPDTYIGRRPIFFLHVPKTAGTSVRHFLEAPLRRQEIHRVMSAPNEIQRRRRERFDPTIKFVSGHVPYWFGDALPGRQTLLFVRNPVERVLSTYYFWRSQPAPAPEDLSEDAELLRTIANVSLEEFVFTEDATWRGGINNYACRMVGHAQPWTLALPFDDQTQKLALERVESIEMIGVVERTNESLAVIARHLGLPFESALPSQNVTQGRPKSTDTSHSIIGAIQDANEGDIVLWERANAELDKRKAARKTFSLAPRLANIDGKFAPTKEGGNPTLRLGEHPLLGSGWLAPWSRHDKTWRFADWNGPATLYVELPANTPLSMEIDCPYAAPDFDFSKLSISVDGETLTHTALPALEHTVLFTSPFKAKPWRRLCRIAFEYSDQRLTKNDTEGGAFAVQAITWRAAAETPALAWPNLNALTNLVARDREQIAAKRDEAIDYVDSLRDVIAKRDAYIDELSTAMEEKDRYAASLLTAMEEKDRHAVAMVTTLMDKDNYAASLLSALDEKDVYAASIMATIEEKDCYAASLAQCIVEKDVYAASLEAALQQKERELAELHAAIERLERQGKRPSAVA